MSLVWTMFRSFFLVEMNAGPALMVLMLVVRLTGSYVNVARGKPAQQIDTYMSEGQAHAAVAVDGQTNMPQYGCTHTITTTNTWWAVDFLKTYRMHAVIIINRNTYPERLKEFFVYVSTFNPVNHPGFPTTRPGQQCFYRKAEINPNLTETINCTKPIVGRYLYVFKPANSILAICELEALATNMTQTGSQFTAISNKRVQTTPFFTQNSSRSVIDCISICLQCQIGDTTLVQYSKNDRHCECIQFSPFDDSNPPPSNASGWNMYISPSN